MPSLIELNRLGIVELHSGKWVTFSPFISCLWCPVSPINGSAVYGVANASLKMHTLCSCISVGRHFSPSALMSYSNSCGLFDLRSSSCEILDGMVYGQQTTLANSVKQDLNANGD